MSTVAFVNGYGAPRDPHNDSNFEGYLGGILKHLEGLRVSHIVLYLAGGYTNREDLSEAAAMHEWFKRKGVPKNISIRLIETTTTARDNLTMLKKLMEFERVLSFDENVLIFCETTRKPTMSFFARKLFSQSTVYGIEFDYESLRLKNVILQRTFKYWLEIAAWHSSIANSFRKWLRKRHIDRVRKRR